MSSLPWQQQKTHSLSETTYIPSCTDFSCARGDLELFKAGHAGYPMILNELPVYPGEGSENRLADNIRLQGVSFYGTAAYLLPNGDPVPHDFVDFIGVYILELRRCFFAEHMRDLLIISNCEKVLVEDSEFTDFGGKPAAPGTGMQWAGGSAINFHSQSYNADVFRNWIHDANGGGIWLPKRDSRFPLNQPLAYGFRCMFNLLEDIMEFGIVTGPPDTEVAFNTVRRIGLAAVSGHSLEGSGVRNDVHHNLFDGAANTNMFLMNPLGWKVYENKLFNSNSLGSPDQAALAIATMGEDAGVGNNVPSDVTIQGNTFRAQNGNGRRRIQLINRTGDPTKLMRNIKILDNDWGPDSEWTFPEKVSFFPSRAEVIDEASCVIPD